MQSGGEKKFEIILYNTETFSSTLMREKLFSYITSPANRAGRGSLGNERWSKVCLFAVA